MTQFYKTNIAGKSFINCDLRYFDFDSLTSMTGYFDVILLDPSIRSDLCDDKPYLNELNLQDIMDFKIERLSKKGFLFFWIP